MMMSYVIQIMDIGNKYLKLRKNIIFVSYELESYYK